MTDKTSEIAEKKNIARNALEEIANIGISQAAELNMPEDMWYKRLFNTCQYIARNALQNIKKEDNGQD